MIASAQISLYPLRQARLGPAIGAVHAALVAHGLKPEVGAMSTVVIGEDAVIFAALAEAFAAAAPSGHIVMTATLSNACPIPER